MSVEILMPELGESVHEGTVSRWLKNVGDFVKEDEPVVEIMTDKVNTELGAPASGVLSKILIQEGEQVEVFHAMGIIDEGGSAGAPAETPKEKPTEAAPAEAAAPAETAKAPVAEPASQELPVVSSNGERKWYSPLVRSMAKANGMSDADLAAIAGTGAGGRVTKRDLEEHLSSGKQGKKPAVKPSLEVKAVQPTVAGPDQEVAPLSGLRKMIAEHMIKSAAIPTVTTITECDVTAMAAFRERNKDAFLEQYGVKLTYTPFFYQGACRIAHGASNRQLQPARRLPTCEEQRRPHWCGRCPWRERSRWTDRSGYSGLPKEDAHRDRQ